MSKKSAFVTICVFLGLVACVEPYDFRFDLDLDIMTVDGLVTDQAGGTSVEIKTSRSRLGTSFDEPLRGCQATIKVSNGTVVALTETAPGIYTPPADFAGKIGLSYQLRFQTKENKNYESNPEPMKTAPAIKNVSQRFEKDGIINGTGTLILGSTTDVLVDFDDPAGERNFYTWRWKLWERQQVCITCVGGRLQNGNCVAIRGASSTTPPTYDYECQSDCWEVLYNKEVPLFSDVVSDGRSTLGFRVARIPYYTFSGALLEIEQMSLSQSAFQYYQILKDQSESTGTLTDAPPSPIVGNMSNLSDANEKVIGYFTASAIKKVRVWLPRAPEAGIKRTLLLGRETNFEVLPPPASPPKFPCVQSRNRTPIKPAGWR